MLLKILSYRLLFREFFPFRMDGVAKFLPCVSGRIFITKYSPQLSFKTENHFFLKKLLYLFYY